MSVGLPTLRVLSVCTGGAGLDCGLGAAESTARLVCAVEIEAFACALLAAQMQNALLDQAPIWSDARTFNGTAWRGAVDIGVAGFPCQDISSAGKRAGIHGERSGLWFSVARIFREVGCPVWFLENVDDITLRGIDVVLGTPAESGFHAVWDVFSAAEVGAPHQRDRWFCLAVADATDGRWRERRESPERAGQPDGNGEALANSNQRRCRKRAESAQPQREASRHGLAAEGGSAIVADALGGRHAGRPSEQGRGAERRLAAAGPGIRGVSVVNADRRGLGTSGRAECLSPHVEPSGVTLAHADAAGCGEQRGIVLPDHGQAARWNDADGRERPSGGLGLFPPGPADSDAWAGVVEYAPWLAPALPQSSLRGLADGMALASRVDLLRLLGNGVVPQQAEHAYRTLRGRLIDAGLWPWEIK